MVTHLDIIINRRINRTVKEASYQTDIRKSQKLVNITM